MVVGKMMFGKEKKLAARETIYSEDEYKGRNYISLKPKGLLELLEGLAKQ